MEQLREMTEAELIAEHDAAAGNTVLGLDYYLEDLARRRADRQTATMVRLTWAIAILTVVNVVLVAATLVAN